MAKDMDSNNKRINRNDAVNGSRYTERINASELKRNSGDTVFGDTVTKRKKTVSKENIADTKKTSDTSKKKKKNKKVQQRLKFVLVIFISLILMFPLALAGMTTFVLSGYEASEFSENEYADDAELLHSSDVYNILLMGIDTLETGNSSRSDAMILMSIDTKHRKIKLSSFLRDSYVEIPGYGNMKLNAACVYGGPQLVCDTIEMNFGVRIDEYAKIGYDMFIKIIDAVDGVTIPEIDETEARALAKEGLEIEPGTDIPLTGENALKYCRIRQGQTDFYRTERQREVISLVLKKLPLSNPSVLINTAKEIAQSIECSVEKRQFTGILMKALLCMTSDIEQMTVPADGTWYDDTKNYQAVLVVDFEENRKLLNEFLYNQGV